MLRFETVVSYEPSVQVKTCGKPHERTSFS